MADTAPRLPDPAVQVLHPAFEKYRIRLASVERLATGLRWAEGPVWFGDGRYLLLSDIPNNRMLRWDEQTGETSVFGNRRTSPTATPETDRAGSSPANTAPAGSPGPSMTARSRFSPTASTASRLNSPNDVVVKSDGTIWFTDPAFGIMGDYEGHRADPELPTNRLPA